MKKIFFLTIALLIVNIANAQWQQMDGPNAGLPTYCFAANSGHVYAGTISGVFVTSNNGQSWDSIGLTYSRVTALLVNGTNIYAGTSDYNLTNNLFFSNNNGISWSSLGMSPNVTSILLYTNRLYVSTPYGIYSTVNNGVNWARKDTGISQKNITSMVMSGTKMYAGTSNKGVYVSVNYGSSWSVDTNGLYDLNINTLTVNGNDIFAATSNGLFHQSVNGTSWIADTAGLTNKYISSVAVSSDSSVYAGTKAGLFISRNYGINWIADTSGIKNNYNTNLYTIAISDTNIFLNYHETNTDFGSLFLSTNKGNSWNSINKNIVKARIFKLYKKANVLFAGSRGDGLYKSTDEGQSWTSANNGMPLINEIRTILSSGNNIYLATSNGIFTSANDGINWTALNNGLPELFATSLSISGNNFYVGLNSSGVYKSTNNGINWSLSGLSNTNMLSSAASGTTVYAGSQGNAIYRSSNSGGSWSQWGNGINSSVVERISIFGSNVFAFSVGTLYKSNILYNGWNMVSSAFAGSDFTDIVYENNIHYAPTSDGRIFFSRNATVSWDSIVQNNTINTAACIVKDSNFFYAGCVGTNTYTGGLWRFSLKDTITAFANPVNAGTTSGSGVYNITDSCSVKAHSNAAYTFVNWTENAVVVSTDSIYKFIVKAKRNLIANFIPMQFTVTTTSNPTNAGTTIGSGTYNINQSCTVKASANLGFAFVNWTENSNIVSTDTNYIFSITANRNLQANFTPNQFTINTSVYPLVGGSTSGSGIYNINQSCLLKAIHAPNYNFTNWTENANVVSIDSNYSFTVIANRNLIANFSLILGISGNSIRNSINIYPNPAKDNLVIELHKAENLNNTCITIYNIQGKEMKKFSLSHSKTEIDISDFSTGLYVVKVMNETESLLRKFFKE